MSGHLTFWYKRYEKIKTRDDKGVVNGVQIVEAEDCINLNDVLRGWWKESNVFTLMLKDAHEESREVEMPPKVREELEKNRKPIPKEKGWFMSQIDLHGVDIRRYRAATEVIVNLSSEDLPSVLAPRLLAPAKPPEVQISTASTPVEEPTLTTSTEPAGMRVVRQEPEEVQQSAPQEVVEPTLSITD